MAATFVLPLCPLEDAVLLPGEKLSIPGGAWSKASIKHARGFGDTVVASLADGESVHEVGVTAMVAEIPEEPTTLHGVSRCRLLSLVSEHVPLVRAEWLPEPLPEGGRAGQLGALLKSRFTKLCQGVGHPPVTLPEGTDLSALTWRITAELGLTPEQQQGFLNVPDPLLRGRLLLVALRELERRHRFLRPWSQLRSTMPWN
jgi:ATP-dependent protease La (LON) substrate-binding domain